MNARTLQNQLEGDEVATPMPEFLQKMNFPSRLLTAEPRPVDLIDGHLLPRGTTTLIATDAGSGKSTSAIVSCSSAAHTGDWTFLGHRRHDKPLKCLVVLGEDNNRTFEGNLAVMPAKVKTDIIEARRSGNLVISPYQSFSRGHDVRKIFDEKGNLTDLGLGLFSAAREWKPDVIVLDTNTSLSEGEFLSKKEAENAVEHCSGLADDCDAAVIVFMHLNREGSGKLSSNSGAGELTNSISGSIGLKNSVRHLLAFARAPEGKFDNIRGRIGSKDELWMVGVKTNVVDGAANHIFPVVRDASEKLLRTHDCEGGMLGDIDDEAEAAVQSRLGSLVPRIVQAASELRSPFAQSSRSKASLEILGSGALSEILEDASSAQIGRALSRLENRGVIVACKSSRAGGGIVWDVPGGAFANEAEYERLTGGKLGFSKGAANPDALRDRMNDISLRDDESQELHELRCAGNVEDMNESEAGSADLDADLDELEKGESGQVEKDGVESAEGEAVEDDPWGGECPI